MSKSNKLNILHDKLRLKLNLYKILLNLYNKDKELLLDNDYDLLFYLSVDTELQSLLQQRMENEKQEQFESKINESNI